MPLVSLRGLYIAELQDLHDAERQLLRELPGIASKATSTRLREALDEHVTQTATQADRLDLIIRQLGSTPSDAPCQAMKGLLTEGQRRLAECERGDVMDAAIIGVAQRIEHYEIAAYGCARTYARTLGETMAADLLQRTLDEEGDADHRLSALAEAGINRSAGEDLPESDRRTRSRLRYVAVSDLHEFPRRAFRIVNEAHEDLGTLDGFVVESRGGRPIYYVVDSGGWFLGRRYLLPVGALQADDEACVLRTTLDRDTIRRYPEFSPSAFLAMDDAEARRYEHRLLSVVAPDVVRRGGRPGYDQLPEYVPPTWLMTGVWMTEGIGLSAVPSRASADADSVCAEKEEQQRTASKADRQEERAEQELVMARGDQEPPPAVRDDIPDSGDVHPLETEQPKTADPRLERYRER
jgi:ferritin-like metal-binding protein YciE